MPVNLLSATLRELHYELVEDITKVFFLHVRIPCSDVVDVVRRQN